MKHLSNDYKDCSNQRENSCKFCYEKGCPLFRVFLIWKEPRVKKCLLILDLKPLRSQVKGKNSIGKGLQSLAVHGKKTRKQKKDQQSCISAFVTYVTISSSN